MHGRAGDRRIAIVGAGLTGLLAARRLAGCGWRVTLIDKGRRPGGRLATRDGPNGPHDHGTPLPDGFAASLGIAAGELGQRPARNRALAAALADGLDLACSTQVQAISRDGDRWRLQLAAAAEDAPPPSAEARAEGYDAVLLTVPVPQLRPLLEPWADLAALDAVVVEPVWTLFWSAPEPPVLPASLQGSTCIAEHQRADEPPAAIPRWTLHLDAATSQRWLEETPAAVIAAVRAALGGALPDDAKAHRWRYARIRRGVGQPYLAAGAGLYAAGDAFTSADAAPGLDAAVASADAVCAALGAA